MKTLIVGTGVIGVIYGWALAEAGVDVSHYVRKGKMNQYPSGVSLDLFDERKNHPQNSIHQYAIRCVEGISVSDAYDLIIVPTNAFQLEEAVKTLKPDSGKAVFLILSANWDGTEVIDQILPPHRYILGYPDGGGTNLQGTFWTNLGGEMHLGKIPGTNPEMFEQVSSLFSRADITPDLQNNILHWLWVHNAGVVSFSVGMAKYKNIDMFLNDRKLLKRCIMSTREMYHLCELRGVNLANYPEIKFIFLPTWLVIPLLRRNFRKNEIVKRYTAHAISEGSLRESSLFFESMMKTAEELDFPMPMSNGLRG